MVVLKKAKLTTMLQVETHRKYRIKNYFVRGFCHVVGIYKYSRYLSGCNIDAAVSRQIYHALDILSWYQSQGNIHNTVVISLGTNGVLDENTVEQLLEMIGKDKSIFWVNVYAPGVEWEASNNKYLNELAKKHSNVTIIDWNSYISKHTDLLEADGIHPIEEGADAYAHLIQEKLMRLWTKTKEN